MTREQQRAVVRDIIMIVSNDLMEDLPRVPADWDEFELRRWIADAFKKEDKPWRNWAKGVKYENDIMENNL